MSDDSTNEEFAERIGLDVSRFTVRRETRGTVRVTTGEWVDRVMQTREVPNELAWICDEGGTPVTSTIHLVSASMCLPDRTVKGTEATDEEIILAVLGDEPIFGGDA